MAGTRITQQHPTALPGRRYGSFSGKTGQTVVTIVDEFDVNVILRRDMDVNVILVREIDGHL